jgi:hypothetical protein
MKKISTFPVSKITIYFVNLFLLALLIFAEARSNSDKMVVITALLYFALLGINLIIVILMQFSKHPMASTFFRSFLMLILIVPALLALWLITES